MKMQLKDTMYGWLPQVYDSLTDKNQDQRSCNAHKRPKPKVI